MLGILSESFWEYLKKMRSMFRPPSFFILFLIVLFLPSGLISPKALLRAVYPFLILSVFINNRKNLVVLMAPFCVLAPAAIFFWYHFHAPPSATLWFVLNGTNWTETFDFLLAYSLPLVFIVLIAVFFMIIVYKKVDGPFYKGKKLKFTALVLLAVPAHYWIKAGSFEKFQYDLGYHFSYSYPWNLILSYRIAHAELEKFKNIKLVRNEDVERGKIILKHSQAPQTIVLVIGESARRDRHSIYGYSLPTNPILGTDPGIFRIDDAITLHPHTVASVPVILTGDDIPIKSESVPWSIVQYFKKAGFKTYWFSNQASLGAEDSLLGFYGKSTDTSLFLHLHSQSLPWAHDGELLNPIFSAIDEKNQSGKKLIVVHLQGSHYGFKRRYPDAFEKFTDPYDNTILYTDYILGKILEKLKYDKKPLDALAYVSDHGLLLNQCGKEFSHFDNKESFEIPYLFWFSSPLSLFGKNPAFFKNIKRRVTTQSVLFSLLDIGGIVLQSKKADQNSLLRDTFTEDVRIVQTYSKKVDFDQSKNSKECHLE